MNLYSYAVQNPIRYRDKSGLFSGADIELSMHFYLGGGTCFDISGHCGTYLGDPAIDDVRQMIESSIDLETKQLAGSLQSNTVYTFSMGGNNYLNITSIYAFGKGYHNYSVKCFAEKQNNCCAKSKCMITYSANDEFVDPIDLHENFGLPKYGSIANLGGTPFSFGLSCNEKYSTTQCKR